MHLPDYDLSSLQIAMSPCQSRGAIRVEGRSRIGKASPGLGDCSTSSSVTVRPASRSLHCGVAGRAQARRTDWLNPGARRRPAFAQPGMRLLQDSLRSDLVHPVHGSSALWRSRWLTKWIVSHERAVECLSG